MAYTPPAEYPFEDSPSTNTPVYAATLDAFVESLDDLDGAAGRVAALETNPLVATDVTSPAVGQLVAVSDDSPLSFALTGLDELIDTTPLTAADFGLAVPQGVRAYANATGQTITNAAYPVYLDLNSVEFNDNVALFTVDLATNRITVNEGGLFLASWDVNYVNSNDLREAYLTRNGGGAISAAAAGAGGLAYRTYPVRLAAGDYVQVICYVEGGDVALITNAAFRCGLALHRIGL